VLLVGAILLSESLYRLSHQDLGFDPNRLITLRVSADAAVTGGGAGLDRVSLTNTLQDRFRSLPGIQNVAAVNMLPFTGPNNYPTQRYGHPESIGGMEIRVVTPDYFATMGIPIQEGRVFTKADDSGATAVIVLSENVARRWWPNGDPLGDLVVRGLFKGQPVPKGSTPDAPRTVVGIVANTKSVSLTERPRPTVYIPYAQTSEGISNFVIRGNLPRCLQSSYGLPQLK